jgi:pimeloyl-ACP methyl ester carboxylesterase
MATVVAAAAVSREAAAAQAELVPAHDTASLLGGGRALGAVIWSHGRSLQKECDLAPTPDYIGAFRSAGWDTFRLNRPSVIDTLQDSADALAGAAEVLKHRGYRRVVLAGQSFGAFISLIAAGRSDAVGAVIATAPAAYGSAQSNPFGFELNATRLYDLLAAVRRARVALFFFEGDIFDPAGAALSRIRSSTRVGWRISSSIGLPGCRPIGAPPARHSPPNLGHASSRSQPTAWHAVTLTAAASKPWLSWPRRRDLRLYRREIQGQS